MEHRRKHLLTYTPAEFVYELKNDKISKGDLVHFVDHYGEHKFFTDLLSIIPKSECRWYTIISGNYHSTKRYFEEH